MKHDLPTTLVYYNEKSGLYPYANEGKHIMATINDVGEDSSLYTLDNDGFCLAHQVTRVKDFLDKVHLDRFSAPDAACELVVKHVPDEAEQLLKGRYQVLNIWRPIKTILKDPFGIASNVPDDDLVHMPYETSDDKDVKYGVRANPDHRWFYKYRQTPNEVLLFKAFDTDTTCKERRVPHSAFTDEDEEDKEPRESIEARALLFYD
ncbi:hypothetical protein EJ08DRAFT_685164 [Tothia fuscella]|uniref:Methyltransferase n=1 Tax=Tothia fuscella TaxID=1048955 RepID=A0A9P4U458_9PEZI|nr:hypothetical protein EJ08DRAFT_685164 [Tothia fuscella]